MMTYHSPPAIYTSPSSPTFGTKMNRDEHSTSSSSSSSSSTTTYRSVVPPLKPLDEVPSTVQNLLLSTKSLQDVLRLWSVQQATESDVSDLYVKIGNELNLTINAFAQHKIDLSDIHSIPAELRVVLESCLSEDASPEVLDKFMPEVRHVLFKLLKGLQNQQESWRLALATQRADSSSSSSFNN